MWKCFGQRKKSQADAEIWHVRENFWKLQNFWFSGFKTEKLYQKRLWPTSYIYYLIEIIPLPGPENCDLNVVLKKISTPRINNSIEKMLRKKSRKNKCSRIHFLTCSRSWVKMISIWSFFFTKKRVVIRVGWFMEIGGRK